MRPDKGIFLALIMASALLIGSTFAIVVTVQNQIPAQSEVVKDSANVPNETAQTATPLEEAAVETPAPGEDPIKASDTTLSPQEAREVQDMLKELGYNQPTLDKSLTAFRQKQMIASNSRYLDDQTLESIISQLSLSKARAF